MLLICCLFFVLLRLFFVNFNSTGVVFNLELISLISFHNSWQRDGNFWRDSPSSLLLVTVTTPAKVSIVHEALFCSLFQHLTIEVASSPNKLLPFTLLYSSIMLRYDKYFGYSFPPLFFGLKSTGNQDLLEFLLFF